MDSQQTFTDDSQNIAFVSGVATQADTVSLEEFIPRSSIVSIGHALGAALGAGRAARSNYYLD